MKKPHSIRQALTEAIDELACNPDKLHCLIQDGRVIATSTTSLSFEYEYTLELIVTDYQGHIDTFIVPILAWLRCHQNEMLSNPELMRHGLSFEVDMLNHNTVDLAIKLNLTERVGVHEQHGQYTIEHYDEPEVNESTSLSLVC